MAPAVRRVDRKRAGPTFSSASTAGTLSDCCSARRTVTAPWWSRSKLRGSQSLKRTGTSSTSDSGCSVRSSKAMA